MQLQSYKINSLMGLFLNFILFELGTQRLAFWQELALSDINNLNSPLSSSTSVFRQF